MGVLSTVPLSLLYHSTDFEQQAQQILASQSQSLSYCQNTTQNVTIVTWSSAHTVDTQSVLPAAATSADNDAPVGGKTDTTVAAVGGALGGALGLLALGVIVAMLLYRRRLRRSSAVSMADSHDLSQNAHTSILTTFVGRNDSVLQSEHTSSQCTIPARGVCHLTLPRLQIQCRHRRPVKARLGCTAPHSF